MLFRVLRPETRAKIDQQRPERLGGARMQHNDPVACGRRRESRLDRRFFALSLLEFRPDALERRAAHRQRIGTPGG